MFRAVTLGGAALLLSLLPASAAWQEPDCRLVKVGGQTRSMRSVFGSGPSTYRHYASGGVDYRCSDGTRVLADSAIVYESDNQVQLYGSVYFQDSETELRADSAFYFSGLKRLNAWSNVQVTDRISGAVIRGEYLTYDQASEFRAFDQITVEGGQPHATFPVASAPVDPPEEKPEEAQAPPDPDSGQARAEPPDPDSGQAEVESPDPDSGQARVQAEPPDPETAQAGDLPPATTEDAAVTVTAATDTFPPTAWEVYADEFLLEGRRYLSAVGQVEIVRDSLRAFGDSLQYDQEVGDMLVTGGARFESQGSALTGTLISLTPAGPRSEQVLAREEARLTSEQVDMTAPAIRLFVDDGKVERVVALPTVPPRPGSDEEIDTSGLTPGDAERLRALSREAAPQGNTELPEDSLPRPAVTAQGFHLAGDSIEVLLPDQRLDRVIAVGEARAEAIEADSLRVLDLPDILRRDWLTGSTIVARFGPAESSDSTTEVIFATQDSVRRLESLTATGDARSFYRMFPPDTAAVGTDPRPALHLVSGNEITIHLEGQEVVKTEIDGEIEGRHFEPQPPAADSVPADSMQVTPDSAADPDTVPPDTVQPPDTGRVAGGRIPATSADPAALSSGAMRTDLLAEATPFVEVPPVDRSVLRGEGLTKIYKRRSVVEDANIQVQQGEIVGLLGPNGAGKTTTFYMLVGLIAADEGRVYLDDTELTSVPMFKRARMGVGYLAQEPSVFRKLTVAQNVMAILETLDLHRKERKERLEELLNELSIRHLRDNKAFSLSGGERRRLEITRALVQRPKFMLLDEPFAGIDPIAVQDIQEIVSQLKTRNIGVIISDHNVEQTLEIVDRACIMHDGRIRVAGTVPELVWNDEVAHLYLGRILTTRMRSRFPRPEG